MSSVSFEGRVVVVTGAGRGLGRAYAHDLARRGAKVVVNDLAEATGGENAEGAHQVVAEIRAFGGTAVACCESVADAQAARRIVELARDTFGGVHAIVANAGAAGSGDFETLDLDRLRSAFDLHVGGAAAIAQAAWGAMRAQNYGRIVMTTSSGGLWGIGGASPYCAAKAAVVGLARALAHEGDPHGIRVNLIAPGAKTRMTASTFGDRSGWTWRPELVAPLVAYLASEACRHQGAIFAAMAGRFARVEIVQGAGVAFDARQEIPIETVVGALEAIDDLADARAMPSGLADTIRAASSRA